jgi:hypothetical protein
MESTNFNQLSSFLSKVPAIQPGIGHGLYEDKNWWVKFSLDLSNDLAWNVVQEFGHIFNSLSLEERIPAAFYPVSAPPYINGGPADYLYWIIESKDPDFSPDKAKEWLVGRLPNPVDNLEEWIIEE